MWIFIYFIIFWKFFLSNLMNFELFIFDDIFVKIYWYFSDIFNISIKSKYQYIYIYQYFKPCLPVIKLDHLS